MPFKLKNFRIQLNVINRKKLFKNHHQIPAPLFVIKQALFRPIPVNKARQERPDSKQKPYLISPSESLKLTSNPLEFWECVLTRMWNHDQEAFRDSIKCQKGKIRQVDLADPSLEEALEFLKESPDHTVAIDLSVWPNYYICIDVDINKVGDRILEMFDNNPELANKVFDCPLVVKTATPGHLHLYYSAEKLPFAQKTKEYPQINRAKLSTNLPTRLGFKAEYLTGVVTLAGQKRIPVIPQKLMDSDELSELPKSLYPYNYERSDGVFTVIEKRVDEDGNIFEEVPGKGRNDRMSQFLKVDTFQNHHAEAINQLCLEIPLEPSELSSIIKSAHKRAPKSRALNQDVFTTEMALSGGNRRPAPEFVNNASERLITARSKGTKDEVYTFINFVENEFNITVEDDRWMGRSYDYVIAYVLLKQRLIRIFYVKEEYTYVHWNGKQWLVSTENEIVDYAYNAALGLKYGGIEERVAKRTIITPLKALSTIDRWPTDHENYGYNFESSIISIKGSGDSTEFDFIPHDPKYMHREIFRASWQDNKSLSLEAISVLSDMTYGRNSLLLQLRFCIFLFVNHFYGNLAYIFYGPGGAGKSIFTAFLRRMLPKELVGTIDDNLLNKALAAKSTLIKDKALILLPDISNKSLSHNSIEFIKVLTGRDLIPTDAKYKDAQSFVSTGFVIATSNDSPQSIGAFRDDGFNQRFVQFPLPGIRGSDKIPEIASILWDNRFQILYWGLSINLEIVSKNLRADNLNAANHFEFSEPELFLLERTVFQKDNKVQTHELALAYADYKKDMGTLREDKPANLSQTIGNTITNFNQKLINRQAVIKWRTNNMRGYVNIAIKPSSGNVRPPQENFILKQDPELLEQLNENPFKDHGFLICKNEGSIQKCAQKDLMAEARNTVTSVAVNEYGLSAAQAAGKRPLTNSPFSHLYSTIADYEKCKKLSDMHWFKVCKAIGGLIEIHDSRNPQQLASPHILDNRITLAAEKLISFQSLKESLFLSVQLIEPPITRWADDGTYRLTKSEIRKALKNKPALSEPKVDQSPPKQESSTSSPSKPQEETSEPKPKRRGRPPKSQSKQVQNDSLPKDTSKEVTPQRKDSKGVSIKPLNRGSFNFKAYQTSDTLDLTTLRSLSTSWLEKNQTLDEESHLSECLKLVENQYAIPDLSKAIDHEFDTSLKFFHAFADRLLDNVENFQYITRYLSFSTPYPHADLFEDLLLNFCIFPLTAPLNLINYLNGTFGTFILDAWALNASSRQRNSDDYYGKQLSGTSLNTQKANRKDTLPFLEDAQTSESQLQYIKTGWTLFPFVYSLGDEDYGRLQAWPRNGLSGLKAGVKRTFLKFIASHSPNLNFVELDIKSCHSVVAFGFFKGDKQGLPDPLNLWPLLIHQFKTSLAQAEKPDNVQDPGGLNYLRSWSDDLIKSLLKTQWYKSLNNGAVYDSADTLEKDRVKFDIPQNAIKDYSNLLKPILQTIPLFQVVTQLQGLLSQNSFIYLPTTPKPFDTATPSNSQTVQGKRSGVSMTAMSRLCTNCEIIVVIMIFLAIAQSKLPLIPISYEADGLLLVGQFSQSDLPDFKVKLNQKLNDLVTLVFSDSFEIEFKRPT